MPISNFSFSFYLNEFPESDDGCRFLVYARWGRVGVKGQERLDTYTSRDSAIHEFEQKFYAKTKNHWYERKEFICYPKSYMWLEMDYSEKGRESFVSSFNSTVLTNYQLKGRQEGNILCS